MRVIVKQKGEGMTLRVARMAQGISQAELATASGCNRASVSGAENGRPIQFKTAYKLAAALNRDFSELFDTETIDG